MKANSRRTKEQKDRDRVDKYIRDNYEEIIYESIAMNAPNVIRQTAAEFLMALSMHGFGAKRLNEVLDWFITVNNMPGELMGRKVDAEDVIETMSAKYGLDFSKIDPHYETYAEYKGKA